MSTAQISLLVAEKSARDLLAHALKAAGFEVVPSPISQNGEPITLPKAADLVVIDEFNLQQPSAQTFAERHPHVPLLLFTRTAEQENLTKALRLGVAGVLQPPLRYQELVKAVEHALARRDAIRRWALLETQRNTRELRDHIDELQALLKVGQVLTSELNPEAVFTAVVNAAVDLTGAEEGVLFLLDDESGDLYLRASRDFENDGPAALRLKVDDSLAGQVIRNGQPVLLDKDVPEKIRTAYLVHALIYVPLAVHGRVIGVLGVDNRRRRGNFTQRHVARLTALAEYAAIAVANAQLFTAANNERRKLETVLRFIKDGILILNENGEAALVNQVAKAVMGIDEESSLSGRHFETFCRNIEVAKGIRSALEGHEYHTEVDAPDGRTFSLHAQPIPQVGCAVTFHDVTHFKEIDRIKSEFVSTVSHDLRSPLTTILGYIDLLERAGPLTPMQRHFTERVHASVENITALIDDLLDLGRIEAGLDEKKEPLALANIIRTAVEAAVPQAEIKKQQLVTRIAENLPVVLGNAVRLRQMLDNIIGNAIKYTPEGGTIKVEAENQGGEAVLRVKDNGPGIPPGEQPYIFNKFFRGSNVATEIPGTGLGLAIVKSIVDAHRGRVWVTSEVGKGTTFTVVLPGYGDEQTV